MIKKVLSAVMAIVLLFGSAATLPEGVFETSSTITASAEGETSGKCGKNVSWSLKNGVLTISGTGKMTDYSDDDDNRSPFYDRQDDIKSVVIKSGVTSIGNEAFTFCENITNVTIPSSVKNIGDYAFSDCWSLKSITIPDSVTSIGDDAFSDCWSLESITIPDSVTSIGDNAFSLCTSLTSVTIPNSVTSISALAFSFCKSLTSVTIPDSVTSIDYGAFSGCEKLKSVTIPDSVTSIGEQAFYDCESLKSVIVPKSVTSIGEKALGYYDDNGTEKKVYWFMICCERYSAADTYAWDNGFDRGFIEGDYIYQYGYSDSIKYSCCWFAC